MSTGSPSRVTRTAPDEPERHEERAAGARALRRRLEQGSRGPDGSSLPRRPAGPARVVGGEPASSPRFGVTTSASESIVRSSPSAGAGLSIVQAPPSRPDPERLAGRGRRDLVGHDDDVARVRVEPGQRGADVGRGQPRVRARGDRDRVLAVGVDEDQRDPGRGVRRA